MGPPRPEAVEEMKQIKLFEHRFKRSYLFSSIVVTTIALPGI